MYPDKDNKLQSPLYVAISACINAYGLIQNE